MIAFRAPHSRGPSIFTLRAVRRSATAPPVLAGGCLAGRDCGTMGAAQGSAPPCPPKGLENPLGIPTAIRKDRFRRPVRGSCRIGPFAGAGQVPHIHAPSSGRFAYGRRQRRLPFPKAAPLACALPRPAPVSRAAASPSRCSSYGERYVASLPTSRLPCAFVCRHVDDPSRLSPSQRPPSTRPGISDAHPPLARRTLPSCLESMQARMIASPAQGPRKPFPFGSAFGKSSSPSGFASPPCPAFARMRRACHEVPERGACSEQEAENERSREKGR